MLHKGIEAWNIWRWSNQDIKPDLSGADLSSMNLAGVDLSNIDLSDVNFSHADLSRTYYRGSNLINTQFIGTNLSSTSFTGANLININLAEAKLIDANFTNTDLTRVNLSKAHFYATDLSGADLSNTNLELTIFDSVILQKTNFSKARIYNTRFLRVDLSQAVNLSKVIIEESPTIDFQSFFLSKGKIPKAFLESCGISEKKLQTLSGAFGIKPEVKYVEVIKEVPQYIEVIKEVPKIEYKYIEVPAAQPTPTIDPQEIEFQKELLATLRSRNQELQKSKALFGLGHVPQHILLEIKELRREIAERKAYLHRHNVAIADHYDD
jgi:uncharacterized protein YjbI with pentapeptide repeats